MKFTNTRGTEIQCNIEKDFIFDKATPSNYNIKAGEDGVIFLNRERLASAIDDSGWLIQIDDACMPDTNTIVLVSSDGVIAMYQNKNDWEYKILLENDNCFYTIKEAHIDGPILYLEVETEFSGVVCHSVDLSP